VAAEPAPPAPAAAQSAGLFASHSPDPGGYNPSTGPVIGRFRTELRGGRIVGVLTPGGRVLVPARRIHPGEGRPPLGAADEDGPFREAAFRALEDAGLGFADIDAVVIGKAPDLFEGVMMPEANWQTL